MSHLPAHGVLHLATCLTPRSSRVSLPKRQEEKSYWTDVEQQLEEIASNFGHTTAAQLRHRMALVEFWRPKAGDRVLEIGCGQGDCTAVLAHAVGGRGKVVATDIAPPGYGAPVSLGETHGDLLSSGAGKRIEFHTCANLLDPKWEFPGEQFDLAVFAHSSWYMSSPQRAREPILAGTALGQAPWLCSVATSPSERQPSPSRGCDSPPGPYPLLLAGAWHREPTFAHHTQPSPMRWRRLRDGPSSMSR